MPWRPDAYIATAPKPYTIGPFSSGPAVPGMKNRVGRAWKEGTSDRDRIFFRATMPLKRRVPALSSPRLLLVRQRPPVMR